LLIICR
jgi:hypothetical protein